jgi:hypothetical protein
MDLELTGKRALVTGATRGTRPRDRRAPGVRGLRAVCARDAGEVERTAAALRDRDVAVHGDAVDVTDAATLGTNLVVDGAQNRPGMSGW